MTNVPYPDTPTVLPYSQHPFACRRHLISRDRPQVPKWMEPNNMRMFPARHTLPCLLLSLSVELGFAGPGLAHAQTTPTFPATSTVLQTANLRAGPSTTGDPACPLKGNISSGGQIFHSLGQRDYCKTVIDTNKGERWFCSAEEAVAAGWRAAMR